VFHTSIGCHSYFTLQDNSFAWFLCQQIAKEIMWHIIFCPNTTYGASLVLAGLNTADLKNVNHPPYATMSLLESGVGLFSLRFFSSI
jgi:hypothetical protein